MEPGIGHNSGLSSREGRCPTCGNKDPHDRSAAHHGFFFVVLRMALENWPESHPFQPIDEPHLRSWLLIEAKHCESELTVRPPGCSVEHLIAITRANRRAFGEEAMHTRLTPMVDQKTGEVTGITVWRPKSLSFKDEDAKRVGARTFNEVCNKVFDIIEQVTGVNIEKWKREKNKWHAA